MDFINFINSISIQKYFGSKLILCVVKKLPRNYVYSFWLAFELRKKCKHNSVSVFKKRNTRLSLMILIYGFDMQHQINGRYFELDGWLKINCDFYCFAFML